MQISKEKRMGAMLTILSVVDFGYCFDNITYITLILSCVLIICSIVSVLFANKKILSLIIITLYYVKELTLYGPTLTWPVLYLFKLIGSQNYIFLLLFSNQIVFNYIDSIWVYNVKRRDHYFIQLTFILLLEGYSQYAKKKTYYQCRRLLRKKFKQEFVLQIFDINQRNITENANFLPVTNKLQTENTLIGSPRGDKINLIQDDKDIHYKLFLNNEQGFSSEFNQQPIQQQIIFKSTKELLQFLLKNNHYFILAIQNDPLLNVKFSYQVRYFEYKNRQILAFSRIDNCLFARQNQKILKYKQNLINIFNHKLKTPLNSAIGHLITAQEDDQIIDQVKKLYLQPALLNCRLQLYLVQDILDYLSIEIEQLPLMNNKTNLKTLLLEVYDLIEIQCKLKNINILFKINNENFKKIEMKSLFIYTDSNKLIRVLLNILNNSYRYTDEGGSIVLEVRLDQMNKITYFSITDNGQGMDEEQINKLNYQLKSFDSTTFNKLNKQQDDNRTIKLGLSLFLANKLIKLLSGDSSFLQLRVTNNQLLFTFSINDIHEIQSASSLGKSKHNSFVKQKSLRVLNNIQFNSQSSPRISKFKQCSQRQIDLKNYNSLRLIYQSEIHNEPQPQVPNRIAIHQNNPKFHHQRQRMKTKKRSLEYQFKSRATSFRTHQIEQIILPEQMQQQQRLIQNEEYILIVDDEPFNHETLCMMLKNMGFKNFLKAFNGQQCLDIVLENHNKIYMIMMDIDMPIMNGIDTTKQLESLISNNKICYIPIIGCTAHEDYDSHLQCFDAGMIHVVVKPVFIKSIKEAINKISELKSNETIKEDTSSDVINRIQSQSFSSQ
ncbi:unnamed protein product (macronuclear) [Paramecium tetraurelia]|uniref:Response regulatory domain-containing protein n=1 Tax=Paramecium tetraurelia TaxID=5888 RepID=A0DH26_PARTE|nr:uncharacterized protein GSPATT00016729001 [Paramecium tetraurelia]CAK82343.1 unnamed protein product [Paramecium tetraurelia]|eukprot:XP_001449740.1 hypothetical protein (macronuclear) [Paramecium tetraurelia strain d4-2]